MTRAPPPTVNRVLTAFILAHVPCASALQGGPAAGQTPVREPSQATTAPALDPKYILNFAKLTKWPATAFASETAPIIVAVVGRDPFGVRLEKTLAGKQVGAREFAITRHARVRDVMHAHVLFVGETSERERTRILRACRSKPVLLMGEYPGFSVAGGTVNFFREEQRTLFEINQASAKKAGLGVSSQLLKLARIVGPRREE